MRQRRRYIPPPRSVHARNGTEAAAPRRAKRHHYRNTPSPSHEGLHVRHTHTPYGDRQHLRQTGMGRGLPPGYARRANSQNSGQGAQRQLPLPRHRAPATDRHASRRARAHRERIMYEKRTTKQSGQKGDVKPPNAISTSLMLCADGRWYRGTFLRPRLRKDANKAWRNQRRCAGLWGASVGGSGAAPERIEKIFGDTSLSAPSGRRKQTKTSS